MSAQARWFFIRESLINLFLCLFFARGALRFLEDYQNTGRASSLIFLLFLTLVVLFSAVRKFPTGVSRKPLEWLAAIAGTIMSAFVVPAG